MSISEHSLVLVEDSLDDEALSIRAVKKSGVDCDIVVLRTGTAAMSAMLLQDYPTPELIILDFHLPKYNGLEILRELRKQKRFQDVPIVMFSSLETDNDYSKCLHEGANSVVQKPVDPLIYVDKVALMVRYWLTVHRKIPVPNSQTGFHTRHQSTHPAPQVHIIKNSFGPTNEQELSPDRRLD